MSNFFYPWTLLLLVLEPSDLDQDFHHQHSKDNFEQGCKDTFRISIEKSIGDVIGAKTNLKIVKNKVASPFKSASVDIIYGKGISHEGELLDIAVDKDIIQKSGAWFSYDGEKIGQGRENVKNYIATNPSFAAEVEAKIRESFNK